MKQWIFIFGLAYFFTLTSGQMNSPDSEARCFQFTWLGPSYSTTNSSIDFTCPKSDRIPCVAPCVITNNSQVPDTAWMLENFNASEVTCRLVTGACMKYSYIYDDTILNTTYFCGKMTEDRTNPITSGCYVHTENGYTIEACACKSHSNIPCNSTPSNYLPPSAFIFLIMILTCYQLI